MDENLKISKQLEQQLLQKLKENDNEVGKNYKRVKLIYNKPRWRNIVYEATNQVCGKVLVGYCLIQKDLVSFIPNNEDITPQTDPKDMQMYCIGLRGITKLERYSQEYQVLFKLHGQSMFKNDYFQDLQKLKEKKKELQDEYDQKEAVYNRKNQKVKKGLEEQIDQMKVESVYQQEQKVGK